MDPTTIAAIAVIVVATLVLALVAATETALERASAARIQAAASRGDARAVRIIGSLDEPRDVLGPLTTARVMSAAFVVSAFAYLGAKQFDALAGAGRVRSHRRSVHCRRADDGRHSRGATAGIHGDATEFRRRSRRVAVHGSSFHPQPSQHASSRSPCKR